MNNSVSYSRLKRGLITLFILFHLMIMVFWGLPGSKFRTALVRWMEPYVIWSGLWHSWDMFSPDPLSLNFNVVAEITFENGEKKHWEFPRMEKLSLLERFQKERYRKWRERVRLDIYQGVWPDTCRWIARQHNHPTNRPTFVALTRFWGAIPKPVPGQDYQPMPATFETPHNYTFHVLAVEPKDLQ